jgi:hypothetical protein
MALRTVIHVLTITLAIGPVRGQISGLDDLAKLIPGRTAPQNALWSENPLSSRFNSSKRVVVAEVKGPAVITMIHFAMPAVAERAPALEEPFRPEKEELPTVDALKERDFRLYMLCGRPEREVIYAEQGFSAEAKTGYTYGGWSLPVYHCRADDQELQIELTVPKGAQGTVRLYVIDPDDFEGGRKQTMRVAGKSLGLVENLQEGRWLEQQITPNESTDGKVLIQARNAKQGSNAVISIIEWIGRD